MDKRSGRLAPIGDLLSNVAKNAHRSKMVKVQPAASRKPDDNKREGVEDGNDCLLVVMTTRHEGTDTSFRD
jgi:hypothetical protein